VNRHIERKHDSGEPVQNPEYGTKSDSYHYRRGVGKVSGSSTSYSKDKKTKSNTFAEKYQFADEKLKAIKDFEEVLYSDEGPIKDLIMEDIFNRIKKSTANQIPLAYLAFQAAMTRPITKNGLEQSNAETIKRLKELEVFQSTVGLGTHTLEAIKQITEPGGYESAIKADNPQNSTTNPYLIKPSKDELDSVLEKFYKLKMKHP
jgi:hypothetical protein